MPDSSPEARARKDMLPSRCTEGGCGKSPKKPAPELPGLPEPGSVRSATYGTPEFLTPISELELEFVTEEEAEGYDPCGSTYDSQWDLERGDEGYESTYDTRGELDSDDDQFEERSESLFACVPCRSARS